MQNLVPVEPCIMVGEILARFVEIGENDLGRQSKLLEYGLFFGANIRASAGLGLIVPVISIPGGYSEDLAAVGTWQPMGANMFPKIALVPAVLSVNMYHIRTSPWPGLETPEFCFWEARCTDLRHSVQHVSDSRSLQGRRDLFQ